LSEEFVLHSISQVGTVCKVPQMGSGETKPSCQAYDQNDEIL